MEEIQANISKLNIGELLVVRTVLNKVTEGVYYGIAAADEVLEAQKELTELVNNGVIKITQVSTQPFFIIELTGIDALLNMLAGILPQATDALRQKQPELEAKRAAHLQALTTHFNSKSKQKEYKVSPIALYVPNASNTATIKLTTTQRIKGFAVTITDLRNELASRGLADISAYTAEGVESTTANLEPVIKLTEGNNGVYFYI